MPEDDLPYAAADTECCPSGHASGRGSSTTVCLLISKYDEARRRGEVDDWTSYDDIGASFNGCVLTAEEYQRAEDRYIAAANLLARAVGTDRFILRHVFLPQPAPSWLGEVYDGRTVGLETALRLLRENLRGGSPSVLLESGQLQIAVETDFYLSARIPESAIGALVEIEKMGLYPIRVPWEQDEEQPVSRPADDRFWAEVATRAASTEGRTRTLVLERWAHGDHGHRWYLVGEGGLPSVARSVRSQSLVTAFFDAEIRWAPRGEIARAVDLLRADNDDPCVVVFPLSGSGALRTLTCGEGTPLPGEAELPPGSEFGFFVWPYEDVVFTQAVVPGEDGRIVAEWPAPWTS
ncbi:hypothetical protein [Streptomyces sp. NPDC050804]|uniref:hypothetical protein n=1 Tax=Streptomyces sp. NPDC050804 TaxID=3154745 RepID=UPI0034426EF5